LRDPECVDDEVLTLYPPAVDEDECVLLLLLLLLWLTGGTFVLLLECASVSVGPPSNVLPVPTDGTFPSCPCASLPANAAVPAKASAHNKYNEDFFIWRSS
jgi:hypothetical protein